MRPKIKQAPSGELYTSEHDIQASCVRWFRLTFIHSYKKCLFSIPNGAVLAGTPAQRARQAQKLKDEGMGPGTADLLLSVALCGLHGLYIETKTPVGSWSDDQKEFCVNMLDQGYGYAIVRSLDDFKRLITDYAFGKYEQKEFSEIWKRKT